MDMAPGSSPIYVGVGCPLRMKFTFEIEIVPTDGTRLNQIFTDARTAFRIP